MTFVVHMTSAHPREDTRIWSKMCRSLAASGYRVALVVADGKGNASPDGIEIVDVGSADSRLGRMIGAASRVYRQAMAMDADIYHFHDPELLPWGALLRIRGKTVIYDAHEDIGRDVLSKAYLPRYLRRAVAVLGDMIERVLTSGLSGTIGATSTIAEKFARRGSQSMDINNYPIASELAPPNDSANVSPPERRDVCYIGGMAEARGIRELVEAMALVHAGAELRLAGEFSEPALEEMLKGSKGWERVIWLGQLDRGGVRDLLASSLAGVVTLHPTPAYVEALPIKMFEYMSAGLPVIASDFPLWRSIIAGADCGLLVDPLDAAAVAGAIDWMSTHPDEAKAMGQRGKAAVFERYNWENEQEKLTSFYAKILSS